MVKERTRTGMKVDECMIEKEKKKTELLEKKKLC